MDLIKLNITLH